MNSRYGRIREGEGKMNKQLKAEIIRKYGSQYLFAGALGIREATVSSVVRNRKRLGEVQRRVWAAALGVDERQLFSENCDG